MSFDQKFLDEAVRLAGDSSGGPFGAVVVKNGEIVARGNNRVTPDKDPTAHAEVVAIRHACQALDDFQLTGCDVYSSCEPCPMCLAALYWARPRHVYFAATRHDAARAGFDDSFIYDELALPADKRHLPVEFRAHPKATEPFTRWTNNTKKIAY